MWKADKTPLLSIFRKSFHFPHFRKLCRLCSHTHPTPTPPPLSCSSSYLLARSLLCLKTRHSLLTVDSSSLRTTCVCHLLGAFSDSPGLWVPWRMHCSPQLWPLLQFLKTSICLSDRCCLNLVCMLWRSFTSPAVYIRRSVGLNTLLLTGFLRDKEKVEKTPEGTPEEKNVQWKPSQNEPYFLFLCRG